MRNLISWAVFLVACLFSGTISAQEWTSLFDGETLDGWNQKGGEAKYEVIDGTIVGSSIPNTPNSFLCTDKNYADFELELEFKVDPLLNSGVQIRSNSLPEYRNGRVHGYQVEMAGVDRGSSAGIYDEARSGWLDPLSRDVTARYALQQGEWNHIRVRAEGDRIRTWLNGYPAADVTDSQTATGFIGLQVHSVGKREEPLQVRWREIRIRENPEEPVVEDVIRNLIPAATAMDHKEFFELAQSGAPDHEKVEEKTLTLMSFTLGMQKTVAEANEYAFLDPTPDPASFADEVMRGAEATIIKEDRITDVHCVVSGDGATGWFEFEVPKVYKGRCQFVAKLDQSKWQITELKMPARGIALVRNDVGRWTIDESFTNDVFSDQPEIIKLSDGYKFLEGPALGPDGRIYFNDIPNQTTHSYDPEENSLRVFRAETGKANGMFWSPADALFSCESGNRRISRNFNGTITTLVDNFEGKKLNTPNDLCLDAEGGLYFTDPRYGNTDSMEMDVQGVYYVPRKKQKAIRVIEDLVRPNGIVLSHDFKTLYVGDHGGKKTWAYDVTGPGELANKRLIANLGSDGMSVDTQGCVYLTAQGAIHVIAPLLDPVDDGGMVYGQKIAELKMPEEPANCLLVGDTLYITARTGFYAVKTNRIGVTQ